MQLAARRSIRILAIAAACAALAAPVIGVRAQDNPASTPAPDAVGTAAVVEVTAHIVHIDADNNEVTLRGPRGESMIVDVDPDVGDVKKLKVGDEVHISYKGALLLSADKVDSKGVRSRVESQSTTPSQGGASTQTRKVEVVATVQKIDRKKRLVTLRGPRRTVTLEVAPDVPLDKIKVGDSIRANYVSATAVQVTRNGAPLQ
jgi:Cu/Ag efflux protein CusF